MGTYLNPGNSGFSEITSSRYVDKTGLIALINETIGTKKKLTCISRPRRFGKSFAAQMLCAYYDKTCDSAPLFENLEIAVSEGFSKTLVNAAELIGNKFIMIIDEWDAPIRENPDILKDYGSDILLVGINYDKDALGNSRKHVCKIEKI